MRVAPLISAVALFGFIVGVVTLHALEPGLPPARYTISEYVNSGTGWLMVACFAMWAVSLGAASAAVARAGNGAVNRERSWQILTALLLAAASGGIALAGVFPTQAVASELPTGEDLTTVGALHNIGSGIATLAVFFAAAVTAVTARFSPELRLASVSACALGLILNGGLLVVGSEVAGVRQRLLVLVACAWQAGLLTIMRRPPLPIEEG